MTGIKFSATGLLMLLGCHVGRGKGDKPKTSCSKREAFLKSKYVRWHIFIGKHEIVINGEETDSKYGKAKLKVASKIIVKTPKESIRIK